MKSGVISVPLMRVMRLKSGDFITAGEIEAEGTYPVYGGNGLRGFTDSWNTEGPIVLVGRQGAHCGNVQIAPAKCWVSEHALRCFPEKNYSVSFVRFALESLSLNRHSVSAAQPGLSTDNLKPIEIPFPSLDTQKRIAGFLDEKTAQIDGLVAKKQALLDRLAEKRQAIITQAVTKGLNPTASMKDSGIEWLGQIPAHWETKRLKFLGKTILGLTYSPSDVVNESEGLLVLRSSNVQNGKLLWGDNVFVLADVPVELIVRPGDILICSRNGSRALIGKNAVITEDYAGQTFGAFMTVFRTRMHRFIHLVLNSELFAFQSGRFMSSTINQLTLNVIADFAVPMPPEDEQQEIVHEVKFRLTQIDRIVDDVKTSLSRLAEYRSALITAAVTSQIGDVR